MEKVRITPIAKQNINILYTNSYGQTAKFTIPEEGIEIDSTMFSGDLKKKIDIQKMSMVLNYEIIKTKQQKVQQQKKTDDNPYEKRGKKIEEKKAEEKKQQTRPEAIKK